VQEGVVVHSNGTGRRGVWGGVGGGGEIKKYISSPLLCRTTQEGITVAHWKNRLNINTQYFPSDLIIPKANKDNLPKKMNKIKTSASD
ncbi:MAG: hypothetical protein WBA93_32245, partial [Microcoleaceae cyanobacterium]